MRTHPFTNQRGKLVRVVDPQDGRHEPHLETSGGYFIGLCVDTGPEILKLAAQGRALWNALSSLVRTFEDVEDPLDIEGAALETARSVLRETARTFDHNEPEPSGGLGFDRHLPECPKSCGSTSGCVCRDDDHLEATREPLRRCLIHFQDEPCPTCAGYKAAGL